MIDFVHDTSLAAEPRTVFDFLLNVRNLPRVMPPSPKVSVIDAPPRLQLGSVFTVVLRKYGIGQKIVSEVVKFEDGVSFTDIQIAGPFARWEHTHTVTPAPDGCTMRDRIIIDPPRGLLGWILTERRLQADLASSFAWRDQAFRKVLGGG